MDLVLIARRLQPLQQLADLLENKYKVNVICISCDLSGINATQEIVKALNGRGISMLIYNAAVSYIGPFIKNSAENHSQAAQVNMITPLNMVHLFGEKMVTKGKGAVVLMTSMAGLQGIGITEFSILKCTSFIVVSLTSEKQNNIV